MNDLGLVFEILVIAGGGALVGILLTQEPIPASRQVRIFFGSLILSALVGYMVSEAQLSRAWYVGSILASALLGETVVKGIRKNTPQVVDNLMEKHFNIKIKPKK